LGTAGDKRHAKAPDAATLQEQGINLIAGTGRIFLAPKGMDEATIKRLREGIKRIFDLPEYEVEMKKIGQQPNWLDGPGLRDRLEGISAAAEEAIAKHNLN